MEGLFLRGNIVLVQLETKKMFSLTDFYVRREKEQTL